MAELLMYLMELFLLVAGALAVTDVALPASDRALGD
jgi:hypothetical protein